MLDQFYKYRNHPLLQQFTDVRAIGLLVFALIMLWMTWSGVQAVHANYQLQQQIAREQQQNDIQRLKNENLKLQNEYYNMAQYFELAARQDYGLAFPGEKELIVPKAVALSHVPAGIADPAQAQTSTATTKQPFMVRNLQAWYDFFLHRTSVAQ